MTAADRLTTTDPPVTYVEQVLRQQRRLVAIYIIVAVPIVIGFAYVVARLAFLRWICGCLM